MQVHHRCPPDEQTDIWCSYIAVATTHHARFETKKSLWSQSQVPNCWKFLEDKD